MNSARQLAARILLGVFTILFLTALVLALASLFLNWGQIEAQQEAEQPEVTSVMPPAGPQTTVAQTTVPIAFDDEGLATISCYRAASGPMAGSFVVELKTVNGTPEEITVGIDLVGAEDNREPRSVTLKAEPGEASITVIVPDSNGPVPIETCTVTAVQQGGQVTLTGN